VLADAVRTTRLLTGAPAAFAAVDAGEGRFDLALRDGLREPGWARVTVTAGRGLGGRVLSERRPWVAPDYLQESTITADFRPIVSAEGLRGMGCVPVAGPRGTAALLYVADREQGHPPDRLIAEVERIADMASVGLRVLDRHERALERLGVAAPAGPAPAGPACELTPREHEVLALLVRGCSNRAIAERLVLSERTVKGHVSRLLEKFGARSRLEVVAAARRERVD
jgi:DNA-binding CsgD family transcriptional regulator